MKAAWDWALSRDSPEAERALVDFAADLGFDTLIVSDPSEHAVEGGHERGLDVFDIVTPTPDDAFREAHGGALQRMLPAEERAADALATETPENYWDLTHRSFRPFRRGDWVCSRHPAARAFLEDRVEDALAVADGIALDGFGFRNQYACFCDRCRERRRDAMEASDDPEPAVLARDSAETLLDVHAHLYEHAKTVDGNATITNHVWPPFRPNPRVGDRYRLDFCSQTIAWFYPPHPSLARVEFEARRLRERETDANTAVPFVGLYADPYKRRSAERVRRELEIALEAGDGHVVFCTLGAPDAEPAIADAVREALS